MVAIFLTPKLMNTAATKKAQTCSVAMQMAPTRGSRFRLRLAATPLLETNGGTMVVDG